MKNIELIENNEKYRINRKIMELMDGWGLRYFQTI